MSFKNKVAIVTGAGRGIGAAIARQLAAQGAHVVLAARTTEEIERVAEEIGQGTGDTFTDDHSKALTSAVILNADGVVDWKQPMEPRAYAITCDVRDPRACENLVAETIREFGQVDILINNAGAAHPAGSFLYIEDAAWDEMFAINVTSAARLTRLVARHLIERSAPGSIVNIASVAGMQAAVAQSAYGASKAALASLTQTTARELGRHRIRVNAVACGLVHTQMAEPVFSRPPLYDKFVQRTPLGCSGEPEDIAAAAVFLASDASHFTTGHIMVVDGGISL